MTTREEALRFFASAERFGIRLGLERMRSLMDRLGGVAEGPGAPLYVHVAGTNGKGSVVTYVASALAAAGYRTGVYTSPYLYRFEERMRILDGSASLDDLVRLPEAGEMPADDLVRLAARVEEATAAMTAAGEEHPTEFELITAAAFLWFAERGCDAVVLETGLGGRLDATNVVRAPAACVVTTLGYDHCDRLGSTLEAIAGEKAAIVKPGCSAVLADPAAGATPEDAAAAEAVVRACCEAAGVPLRVVRADEATVLAYGLDALDGASGQSFRSDPPGAVLATTLLGAYQPFNAAVAYRTLEALAAHPRLARLDAGAIARGFRQAVWPGRCEIAARTPPVVLDGAHNPQGAASLESTLSALFPGRNLHFVCGVSADKDYAGILRAVVPPGEFGLGARYRAASIRCVAADHPRALPAAALAAAARRAGAHDLRVETHADPEEAMRDAMEEAAEDDGAVCAFGSLFLLRQARSAVDRWNAASSGEGNRP